jgi:excisionase family DNA binding protein
MVLVVDDLRGRFYTVAEVAKMLGIVADSVRRRIRDGQMPARTVPGVPGYTISGDDLAEYLKGTPYKPPERPRKRKPKAPATATPTPPSIFPEASEAPRATTKAPPVSPRLSHPAKPQAAPVAAIPFAFPPEANGRLVAFMERGGISQKELAEATGLRSDKVSRLVNGKRNITRATAAMLQSGYGDELVFWLLSGEGPAPEVER